MNIEDLKKQHNTIKDNYFELIQKINNIEKLLGKNYHLKANEFEFEKKIMDSYVNLLIVLEDQLEALGVNVNDENLVFGFELEDSKN